MHGTVYDFVQRTLTREHVEGKRVLEVGSYDVNGSVRPFVESLEPAIYLGVDATAGRCVDQVVDCESLTASVEISAWDLVITTEMLEHVDDWRACMAQLVSAVKPGGYLLITTRSPGFPYHPFPVDNWRYTQKQMFEILTALDMVVIALEEDPQPGVFVLARKPDTCGRWRVSPERLRDIEIERMTP
jgi:SAM-dependent methyltransferase